MAGTRKETDILGGAFIEDPANLTEFKTPDGISYLANKDTSFVALPNAKGPITYDGTVFMQYKADKQDWVHVETKDDTVRASLLGKYQKASEDLQSRLTSGEGEQEAEFTEEPAEEPLDETQAPGPAPVPIPAAMPTPQVQYVNFLKDTKEGYMVKVKVGANEYTYRLSGLFNKITGADGKPLTVPADCVDAMKDAWLNHREDFVKKYAPK